MKLAIEVLALQPHLSCLPNLLGWLRNCLRDNWLAHNFRVWLRSNKGIIRDLFDSGILTGTAR